MNIKGFVEIWQGDKKLGSFCNSILYSGYDLAARAIGGDPTAIINGMYIQYKNGDPIEPVINLDRTPAYYANLTNPEGCLRVKTIADPIYSSTSNLYKTNKVQFIVQTNNQSFAGAPVIDGTTKFYSIALAAIPDLNNPGKDVLFSAAPIYVNNTFAPQLKIANMQLTFIWYIVFSI